MRFGYCGLLLILSFLAGCEGEPPPVASNEWIPLFDGETLDGWSVACKPDDAGKEFWKVADGAITCDSRGRPDHNYVWLISEGEYDNFELKLQVRADADLPGNSGIQVRSRYDAEAGWLHGPQIDIHPPAPWRTGLIYDETRGVQRWIHPSLPNWEIDETYAPAGWTWNEGWNDLQITCDGTRIKTVVNDNVATDEDFAGLLDDDTHQDQEVGLNGHIALQLHSSDELYIQFREILLRPLH